MITTALSDVSERLPIVRRRVWSSSRAVVSWAPLETVASLSCCKFTPAQVPGGE
jgi:hypothetical protein